MPRPGSEPPLADRWLAERGALLRGGPTQRYRTRARVVMGRERVPWGDPEHSPRLDLLSRHGQTRPVVDRVDVALYPRDAAHGSLPLVIVPVLGSGVLALLEAQGGEAEVRGEPGPGHGLVLVPDDGDPLGCIGPARPPPAIGGKHLWGL